MTLDEARALRLKINEAKRASLETRAAYNRAVTEMGRRAEEMLAAENAEIELRKVWDALPIELIADLAYTLGGVRGGS